MGGKNVGLSSVAMVNINACSLKYFLKAPFFPTVSQHENAYNDNSDYEYNKI